VLSSIVNPDGTLNGEASPVAAGAVLTLYATGEGITDGANIAGKPAGVPLAAPVLPVTVTFAGLKGDVLFAGSAPGMVGVMQMNVRVPGGVAVGKADLGLFVGAVPAPAVPIWLK